MVRFKQELSIDNDDTRRLKQHEDMLFGFKVALLNVVSVKRLGEWCLEVNWVALGNRLFQALAEKPGRLTGNELRFIRKHQDMTLEQFAKRFNVTHPAVMKWEKAGDDMTGMNWATEKDIRLAILARCEVGPDQFQIAYQSLEQPPSGRVKRVYKYDVATDTLRV